MKFEESDHEDGLGGGHGARGYDGGHDVGSVVESVRVVENDDDENGEDGQRKQQAHGVKTGVRRDLCDLCAAGLRR